MGGVLNPMQPAYAYDHGYDDRELEYLCDLVRQHTGIAMDETKRDLLYSRVTRRLKALDVETFSEYRKLLSSDSSGAETQQFINSITTNLTAFFRQQEQFDYLQKLLPDLAQRTTLKVWSTAASTGEEPYTIAYILGALLSSVNVRILATDIDTQVLQTAQTGVYTLDRLTNTPADFMRNAFLKGTGANEGKIRVKDELKSLVTFRPLNLLGPWPVSGPFDIVFCRSIVIYFDKPTQRQLFSRLAEVQRAGSYLFVGPSESLVKVSSDYELLGHSIYRRK